ncbi:MAG: hypothetical protein Q3966_07015 [Neisseria sp.]|nr:hypothetical protein [Neisseria sp.]
MPNQRSRDLGRLLIIDRPKQLRRGPGWQNVFVRCLTGLLWLGAAYHFAAHAPRIFTQPVYSGWTLLQLAKAVLTANLVQLNLLLLWTLVLRYGERRGRGSYGAGG